MKAKDLYCLAINVTRDRETQAITVSFNASLHCPPPFSISGSAGLSDAEVDRLLVPLLVHVADRFSSLVK